VQKLKKDLELITIQQETSEASLRKRHQEAINDLTDQLEQLNRQRNKSAATHNTPLLLHTPCLPPQKKTTLMSDAIALTISTDFNNFLAELLLSEAIKW